MSSASGSNVYPLEALIATGFISFIIGFVSHMALSRSEVAFEKRVALAILVAWIAFAMLAYIQDRELSIFFNAGGMAAIGNLLGIKTSELVGQFFPKRK